MTGVYMDEFAQQLRSGLDHATDGVYPSARFDELFLGSVRRRNRRRRTSVATAAAMAGAALAGTFISIGHSGPGRTSVHYATGPQVTAAPTGAEWSWTSLPAAPIAPRIEDFSVWTGSEMIVWGGAGASSSDSSQGAAYEPATDAWTKLPSAPISGRVGAVGVWTGTEALIFGGSGAAGEPTDGAAYDPTTNAWRKLRAAPLGNLTASGSYAVWTGKQMLAWGFFATTSRAPSHSGCGNDSHGGGSCAIAMFDPSTNKWTVGAAAPVEAPIFGDAFWTGAEMIVVGWGGGSGPGIAIAYNPQTNTWRQLPVSPLSGARTDELAAWDGTELIVGGGRGPAANQSQDDAAAYNPATNTWRQLPDAPEGFTGSQEYPDVWTGHYVISLDDNDAQGRPLILDPATGTWQLGPAASQPDITGTPAIWTGTEIIRWSGGTPYPTGQSDSAGCCKYVPGGEALTVGN